MDYRFRKYYLVSTPFVFIEDTIQNIKQALGSNVKIHKLPSKNIPNGYCKVMISCDRLHNELFKSKVVEIGLIMSFKSNNPLYFREITKEDLGQ